MQQRRGSLARRSVVATVLLAGPVFAEAPNAITLAGAVKQSLEKYPSIRVSLERVSEASARINLARTAYLPRIDFLSQLNRATRNNVYGMLLPQSILPNISGPPNPSNSLTSVWGSAAGLLVSWEPLDFGFRKANVEVSAAERKRAEAAVDRTRFEVAASAADAFLTILAARETLAAAEAGVKRGEILHQLVGALVKAELRPGADASRSRAELAMAETQRIQAEQAVAETRAALSQFLGALPGEVAVAPGKLLSSPPGAPVEAGSVDAHPVLKEQSAAVDESKARQKALEKSLYPKLNAQAATYARGTGANPDFTTGGAASGLGPNVHNWGVGLTLSVPVTGYLTVREQRRAESARERGEAARYAQLRQDLAARLDGAKARLAGAQRVAANLPFQLEAARAAETQATARYRAGLGTLAEVADAQRLLTQTEIDDSLAKLQVWRAMLAVAVAQGDLRPFLDQASGN